MSDLVARVTERLDELEAAAVAATPGPWWALDGGVCTAEQDVDGQHSWPVESGGRADRVHIALNDPDQTKRLVAGLRAVVALHEPPRGFCPECGVDSPCPTLTALASTWEVGS